MVWADAVIFGTPTRYGNVTAQLKQFLDTLGGLWQAGQLADKVYSGFTASSTTHGGQESTLLALYNTIYHFGGILVPPGYTDPSKFVDGNPYGTSHVSGQGDIPVAEQTLTAARVQLNVSSSSPGPSRPDSRQRTEETAHDGAPPGTARPARPLRGTPQTRPQPVLRGGRPDRAHGRGATDAPAPEDPLPPSTAYRLVHDELMLDGNSRLNLATFVTTWMEPQAGVLMGECRDKNMIDKDEYPRTAELERRCVAMLADLWNAPDPASTVGCSTTGSSEACMLAGMALKRRWSARNADRYPATARPNLVMGVNVQVCWEKFCTFWEVEPRQVPMDGERFHLDPQAAAELCDENTIGVVGILGSTFDGSYEPIADLCAALDDLEGAPGSTSRSMWTARPGR